MYWDFGYYLNEDVKVTSLKQFLEHLDISFSLGIIFLRFRIHLKKSNTDVIMHTFSSSYILFRNIAFMKAY